MFEPYLLAMLSLPLFVHHHMLGRRLPARAPAARSSARSHIMELRVDVQLGPGEVDDELQSLQARLQRTGLIDSATEILQNQCPGLMFRHREADGEHYVYVLDVARGCLAGYTVFNRLIEVNRRVDRFVRAPHSKYALDYQRRGIATAVYEWALGQGFCLISGARQSPGAHALWRSLAMSHQLAYIEVRDKNIAFLETPVDELTRDSLQTRMLLFGKGWDIDRWQLTVGQARGSGAKVPAAPGPSGRRGQASAST